MKYKTGDTLTVLGDWEHTNHTFPIGTTVVVVRHHLPLNTYDVHDITGTACWVHEKDLEPFNTNKQTMKAMKDAVLATAKSLCKANNTVTTLEIKTEVRRDYPYYFWTQDVVSKFMDQLAGDGIFTYTDNGTYRTYTLVSAKKSSAPVSPVTSTFGSTFGKIAGTVPTKTVAKRGRPRKTSTIVNRANALNLLSKGSFGFATFNGRGDSHVNPLDIKIQKKSVAAYLTRRLNTLTSINVGGVTYTIV